MAFAIKLSGSAAAELKALRIFDRRWIGEEIDKHLRDQPEVSTRNRKCLRDFVPDFEHDPPIWELRVGEFRVFYDVNTAGQLVSVRAIRQKAHGQTTEDIT
jgi:mRNA-degrading endonuclease RelE of RelBE toxin-antitoxin system